MRTRFLVARDLIFAVARGEGVGPLSETLTWGQPSYRPERNRCGTTLRLGCDKRSPETPMLYVPCSTTLVADYRERYEGLLSFTGNRAVALGVDDGAQREALRHCIGLALTYHARKAGKT